MRIKFTRKSIVCGVVILFIASLEHAQSQSLPGPADAGRIVSPFQFKVSPSLPDSVSIPQPTPPVDISALDEARQVSLRLEGVRLEGVTAFPEPQLVDSYSEYIGKDVTLDVAWLIAARITEHYRNEGYFLSRAYVPAQEVGDGTVLIRVVEGRIGKVVLEDEIKKYSIIGHLIDQVMAETPIRGQVLESFLLRLNDLQGMNFRGVVEPLPDGEDGVVQLTLLPEVEPYRAIVRFDNYGSRFLGPYQAMAMYRDSVIPFQQTTLSVLTSLPMDELKYGSLQHRIPLYSEWTLELFGGYVNSVPGSSLAVNDIESQSVQLGVGLIWQPIRRVQENLSFLLALDGKNTNGDILGDNPLIRDNVRIARLRMDYDSADRWNGHHFLSLDVNRGLGLAGASDAGDPNLSRAQATPDFTVFSAHYLHRQSLPGDWMLTAQIAGQYASGPLYSTEEFGIGGQSFGRAYDSSEIAGDHGLAGMFKMGYYGIDLWHGTKVTPYGFYEIGKVWNEDTGGRQLSAASAGFGIRANHASGLSGDLGVAWPLTLPAGMPLYGGEHSSRFLLQVGYDF